MNKWLFVTFFVLAGCDTANNHQLEYTNNAVPLVDNTNPWFQSAAMQVKQKTVDVQRIQHQMGSAKNIILFLGDGMSLTTVTAARILDGQQQGLLGEENNLSFDGFPFSGLAKTYSVDAQVPDSASTMTAMMSGVKTDFGIVGIAESVTRGNVPPTWVMS